MCKFSFGSTGRMWMSAMFAVILVGCGGGKAEAGDYRLKVSVNPPKGGSISISPNKDTYNEWEDVDVTAKVANGYVFTGWSGDDTSDEERITIKMSGNKNKKLTANFISEKEFEAKQAAEKEKWYTTPEGIMAEAPMVMRGFETSYIVAVAEKESISNIAKDDLIFTIPRSEHFEYTFITSANGGIVGCRAIALSDIGKFAKGNFLQTIARSDIGKFAKRSLVNKPSMEEDLNVFTHCTGGSNASEAFGVAKSLTPNFFRLTGDGVCQ